MGKRNLRIDLIESFANMVDGVLGEGVRHSTPSWAGGATPAHPQSKVGFSLLAAQFLPELPSKRIQVNLFDSAMGQMSVAPFGDALGFSHQRPIGLRPVAGLRPGGQLCSKCLESGPFPRRSQEDGWGDDRP